MKEMYQTLYGNGSVHWAVLIQICFSNRDRISRSQRHQNLKLKVELLGKFLSSQLKKILDPFHINGQVFAQNATFSHKKPQRIINTDALKFNVVFQCCVFRYDYHYQLILAALNSDISICCFRRGCRRRRCAAVIYFLFERFAFAGNNMHLYKMYLCIWMRVWLKLVLNISKILVANVWTKYLWDVLPCATLGF